jgi:hypothetical protein
MALIEIDGYRWFTVLKNRWIFHGELLNNLMVFPNINNSTKMRILRPLLMDLRNNISIDTWEMPWLHGAVWALSSNVIFGTPCFQNPPNHGWSMRNLSSRIMIKYDKYPVY